MHTLAATAERLRMVKTAHQRFLALWAADCIFSQVQPLQDVLTDLQACLPGPATPEVIGRSSRLLGVLEMDDE